MALDVPPPASVQTVQGPATAQLVESQSFGKIEFRRYEVPAADILPAENNAGYVSVLRTQEGWKNPEKVKRTIYFFHAGTTPDRIIIDFGIPAVLNTIDAEISVDDVQIVSPYYGDTFLSAPYEKWLWSHVVPWAESGTQTQVGSRFTMGGSMGGYVALYLFLSRPEFFAGTAANAPALVTWDFKSPEAIQSYGVRTGLGGDSAAYLAAFVSGAFPDRASYDQRDPLGLASSMNTYRIAGKSVYLDVGSKDNLGLQEGTIEFQKRMSDLSVSRFFFKVVEGGLHDGAYFYGRMNETLRFLLQSSSN